MSKNVSHSIRDSLLQTPITPILPKNLMTPRNVPPCRINALWKDLLRVAFTHSVPSLRKVFPNDIDDKLWRDQPGHEQNTLPRGPWSGQSENMRVGYIPHIDLIGHGVSIDQCAARLSARGPSQNDSTETALSLYLYTSHSGS